jgi:hypothetical protein
MRAVNLIPVDQRDAAALGAGRSQGGAYAVLVLFAGLALLVFLYGMARHQVSSRQSKAVALEAHAQQVQANAARLVPYTSFIALREQRLHAVAQLVDSRFDWAHSFHELGRVLPGGVAITSVTGAIAAPGGPGGAASSSTSGAAGSSSTSGAAGSGSTSGAAGTGSTSGAAGTAGTSGATGASTANAASGGAVASVTPPGSVPTFTVTGCAVNQSTVARALERLRLMDGVSTVTLQSSTKSTGGGATSGNGSCPVSAPVFSLQVAFVALPVPSLVSTAGAKSIGAKG